MAKDVMEKIVAQLDRALPQDRLVGLLGGIGGVGNLWPPAVDRMPSAASLNVENFSFRRLVKKGEL